MRLEVTKRSGLAIRAIMALAERDTRLKGAELAEIVGTTTAFVSQVVTPMVQLGWVRSDPGPTGGYSCAVDLADISLLDVIDSERALLQFEKSYWRACANYLQSEAQLDVLCGGELR